MNPKVTVIMPSLNVVRYIRPCMESVLAQTMHDIEILAIDAGSDDGTLEILEAFAMQDDRVKVLHSEKRSYGYQLNRGIAHARGEYIAVVETDDVIASDMCEALCNVAEEVDAEYVKGRAVRFMKWDTGMEWKQAVGTPLADSRMCGEIIEPRKMPELLVKDIYLWTGIYKKEFIRSILLNETPGAAFQDQGFLFQTISLAKKAVYLDKIVYYYRQDNSNSSIFNKRGFHYLAEEYAYIEKFLADKDKTWRKVFYQRMWNQSLGRFRTMAISGMYWEEAVPDMEILRKRLKEAVEDHYLQSADLDAKKWELLSLFLYDVRAVYDYYAAEYRKKIEIIQKLVDVIAEHKVVIFGAGEYGRFFHALLESKKPKASVAYCDNNTELWNSKIQGMTVLSPEEAVKRYPDAIYVIANKRYVDQIREQLHHLKIRDSCIILFQENDMLLFQAKDGQKYARRRTDS